MLITSLHYLPSLEYMVSILQQEHCVIDTQENYQKQSYRNRCHILSSHGIQTLSIPVIKGNSKQRLKDVKIDYDQKWLNVHWRSITSSYGKAAFFEYFADYFHDIFFKKEPFLVDLNIQLLTLCLKLLQINTDIQFANSYQASEDLTDQLDTRNLIHPKRSFSENTWYQPVSYFQQFGDSFVPNLSILDLLFCEGTNAKEVLKKSLQAS